MSQDVGATLDPVPITPEEVSTTTPTGSFVSHAKLIGLITFASRLLGLARESIAANYFGAGAIWSAFTVAFTVPNLFRKLFGEGALSAAFIPLYAQAVKREQSREKGQKTTIDPPADTTVVDYRNPTTDSLADPTSAADFAAASVNLLGAILLGLTIIGELILFAMMLFHLRPDYALAVKLSAIMLPYVLLVCGTAFLGGILQVHNRFAATAATSIVLNLCLIVAIVIAAGMFDLKTPEGQTAGVYWLSIGVLISGFAQIVMLFPSLKAAGFRFKLIWHLWTPAIRKMLKLSLPVALGAGVLQLGVMFDKGISFLLASQGAYTHFSMLGHSIRYPLAEGAAARLNWAQFMYQFPLGVFAIALATAIFPKLSADALDHGQEQFRAILRQGIQASLFIGLPASVGMIVVRYPAVRLLFERGNFTYSDTKWVALSTAIYSGAIWAFSLQQILNRAYYALHDTWTPLVWGIINLSLNLIIEIPLLWTHLGEAGMAVGTLVSFAIQSVAMLWMLDRRVGSLDLGKIMPSIFKMVIASLAMWGMCVAVQHVPGYPTGHGKIAWALQLFILMTVGGVVYFGLSMAMGIEGVEYLWRKRAHTR